MPPVSPIQVPRRPPAHRLWSLAPRNPPSAYNLPSNRLAMSSTEVENGGAHACRAMGRRWAHSRRVQRAPWATASRKHRAGPRHVLWCCPAEAPSRNGRPLPPPRAVAANPTTSIKSELPGRMARCEFYRRRSTGAEARRRFIAARRHIGGEARGVHGPGLGTRVAVSGRSRAPRRNRPGPRPPWVSADASSQLPFFSYRAGCDRFAEGSRRRAPPQVLAPLARACSSYPRCPCP